MLLIVLKQGFNSTKNLGAVTTNCGLPRTIDSLAYYSAINTRWHITASQQAVWFNRTGRAVKQREGSVKARSSIRGEQVRGTETQIF